MGIKCGCCSGSHETVGAVKECYGGNSAAQASRAGLIERAEYRKSFATKNTMGGSSSGRMATPKMVRFVQSLARDREMTPGTAADAMQRIDEDRLTFDYARQFIDAYKDAPAKVIRTQGTPKRTVEQDGMYRDPDTGAIYKVQRNKAQGDGSRLYAKRLVLDGVPKGETRKQYHITPGTPVEEGTASVSFHYAAGAMREIQPEWKMTADEAREFGALYGTCVRCGRTLTLEESIERSMGPVCAAREGWA